MSKQNSLLVGLDLSPMDDFLLSFLDENAQKITDQRIIILHITANERTASEVREAQILQNLPQSLAGSEIIIKSGNPEKELERICEAMKIDMVVLGQKPEPENHIKAGKFSEKAKSSLLLIPAKEDYKINSVCVALDFSDNSITVLRAARNIADNLGAHLKGLHTYQVPSGYHKTGKDHKEFAREMEHNAKKEAEIFFKKTGISIDMNYRYEEDQNTAQCIAGYVSENPVDLLIMGSKGRTNAASVIHGSVAKKAIREIQHTPVMILKRKNKNMDLIDAIKEV
ncbi:MAG: universal stress protein [Marinoscillum sp.]